MYQIGCVFPCDAGFGWRCVSRVLWKQSLALILDDNWTYCQRRDLVSIGAG